MPTQLVPITFRVPQESADVIDRLAHGQGSSRGEFVRQLVLDALKGSDQREPPVNAAEQTGAQLMSHLQELVDRLESQLARLAAVNATPAPDRCQLHPEIVALPQQINRLVEAISEMMSSTKIINMADSEIAELRKQTARMLGMLYQYRTGDESPERASAFAKLVFPRSDTVQAGDK